MTVEELEAAVWQAMRDHKVTVPTPVTFTDQIVGLAMRFAVGDCPDLRLLRRLVLAVDRAR